MTAADLMGQFGEQHVTAFILVLARVSPLFVLAPMFSSKLVPTRVRGIVAVALAIGLSPVVSKGVTLPTGVMDVTWLVLKDGELMWPPPKPPRTPRPRSTSFRP